MKKIHWLIFFVCLLQATDDEVSTSSDRQKPKQKIELILK